MNRASGFNDPVSFVVTTPPGFTATQPAPAGTSSQFYLATAGDAGAGDFEVTVTGSSTTLVQNAKLGVHVGSLLAIGDGGVVEVPVFATSVTVKLWGGAGGAGENGCNFQFDAGGAGGGGGFASAVVPVSGGNYVAVIGGGGGWTPSCEGHGGGGGGYSAFLAGDAGVILVAGGGGGGASVWQNSGGYGLGANGGTGGGVTGSNGLGICLNNCSSTYGGGPDGGGSGLFGGGSGGSLAGGDAINPYLTSGGANGGGNGGTHAGGGGGGYYGGAGGGEYTTTQPYYAGAGGGGCGWNPFDGGTLTSATGMTPPATNDPDYAGGAGAATKNASGNPGRVVIRLPKP